MTKDFVSWLYEKCNDDYIRAKKESLHYTYEAFEELLKEIKLLDDKTQPIILDSNYKKLIENAKNEYDYLQDCSVRGYSYTRGILNWYSWTIDMIKRIIK